MKKSVLEFKHWFECVYSKLEDHEEEIFFQHPVEEIRCNQLGILYYDESRYVSYDMRSGTVVREHGSYNGGRPRLVGTKQKVIWECFHNQILDPGCHFLYTNCNPIDFSIENLLAVPSIDKSFKLELLRKKNRFIKTSVEHLVKLETKYEKRDIDKNTLYELLQLPNWLLGARKKWTGPVPKALVKKKRETFPQ